MLSVSCLIMFANPKREPSDLVNTLEALAAQSHPLHEVIILDDAPESDKAQIAAVCQRFGHRHMVFPFSNWALACARMYNEGFAQSTGQAILVLDPHWVVAPNWVEVMARWLEQLGHGHLVSTENDRRNIPRQVGGPPEDWFAGYPVCFGAPNYHYIDHAKVMLHREDWLPFDTDFDCPDGDDTGEKGNLHGFVYWGYQHEQAGHKLWLRRDLEMHHATGTHTPEVLAKSDQRYAWSQAIFHGKGAL